MRLFLARLEEVAAARPIFTEWGASCNATIVVVYAVLPGISLGALSPIPVAAASPAAGSSALISLFLSSPLLPPLSPSFSLKWFVEAELTNGRWAMFAVAGILFTELAGVPGKWYEAGAQEYWISPAPQLAVLFPVVGWFELKRLANFNAKGQGGLLDFVPFDPLNLGASSQDMKTKEVSNSRLAMIAFAGFAVQAILTRQGPIEGLLAHIQDPLNYNILTNLVRAGPDGKSGACRGRPLVSESPPRSSFAP